MEPALLAYNHIVITFLPPILFLSVGYFLHDPVNLLASTILSIAVISQITFQKKKHDIPPCFEVKVILAITLFYVISSVFNRVPFIESLQGNYQRNFGIFYWLSMAGLVHIYSSEQIKLEKFLYQSLPILAVLATTYGLFQKLNQDPLPWKNEFDAVQLTLGNPNFAGALLGMISVIYFDGFIRNREVKKKVAYFVMWSLNYYVALGTNSLQSHAIIFIVSSVYLVVLYANSPKKYIRFSIRSLLFTTCSLLPIAIFMVTSKFGAFGGIRDKFYFEGNVSARLDYWITGIKMFRDNLIFGVGPDQFQKYAAVYRDANQVLRDGAFVIPDKAHNTMIDQFANGGIFVGILWCVLVASISIQPLLIAKIQLAKDFRFRLAILTSIWFSYVFQALISPDQVQLSVLGFASGALLLQECRAVHVSNKKLEMQTKI